MIGRSQKCIPLLLLIMVLFFSMRSAAFAASQDSKIQEAGTGTIGVQWVNADLVDADLSFDGSKGLCGAMVIGKSGTTRITGTVVLARKNANGTYTTVKTWSGLEAIGSRLLFDKTHYVSPGYTYRLTITATVYRNGTGEKVTDYNEAYAL